MEHIRYFPHEIDLISKEALSSSRDLHVVYGRIFFILNKKLLADHSYIFHFIGVRHSISFVHAAQHWKKCLTINQG